MLTDLKGVIWMDGEWVDWQQANIHVLSHTLHYGMGVFEGIRAYETARGPAIFRLQDHIDRLFRSAKILGLPMNFDKPTLMQAHRDVVAKNNLKSAYLRPIVYLGAEQLGLHIDLSSTHTAIAAWEWGAYLGEENKVKGLKVGISSFHRHHINASMCKAKANGNYINSTLAVQEAQRHGYNEAIMLDSAGNVAEGPGENIFIVRHNALFTPDTTAILEGITRETIMQFAREFGIDVTEKRLTRDDIYTADEAFFTGTAAEVVPIVECDGRPIGTGKRGPVTETLQKTYFDMVMGVTHPDHPWLTYCKDDL